MISGVCLEEPELMFGTGSHVDPQTGITLFGPYDLNQPRPKQVRLGFVGRQDSLRLATSWVERGKHRVETKQTTSGTYYAPFPGFNEEGGFYSEIEYDQSMCRSIKPEEIEAVINEAINQVECIDFLSSLFVREIKFLALNKKVDVIICCISNDLFKMGAGYDDINAPQDSKEDDEPEPQDIVEYNFRRLLKAKAMEYNIPLQLILDETASTMESSVDIASRYWNFFSALYYKAGGIPWALSRKSQSHTCYAGISFYNSRDKSSLQSSSAQIFNEHGNGIILRGGEAKIHKSDRQPHLDKDNSFQLLDNGLKEYYEAMKHFPQRVVLHKSSNYTNDEINGFQKAATKHSIHTLELVTILPSSVRITSKNIYPPNRGTLFTLNNDIRILYTRGFVPHYNTYRGSYIPSPLELRFFSPIGDPELVASEILMLSKINWNSTRFDRKLPITISSSDAVGDILKYVEGFSPKVRYSFYM